MSQSQSRNAVTRVGAIAAAALLVSCMPALAQTHFDASTLWRNNAPKHFFNNKCCFCRAVESARVRSKGVTEYLVGNRWYAIPDSYIMTADPEHHVAETHICDPIKPRGEQYLCVVPGVGM